MFTWKGSQSKGPHLAPHSWRNSINGFIARNKGNEPIGIFYLWYDAALSLLKAMEVARTLDTDKIVEVMGSDTFTWEGPFGRNRFFGKAQIGQNRNPARRTVIMRVEGTKVKVVGEYAF